jgi:hypothetical protein
MPKADEVALRETKGRSDRETGKDFKMQGIGKLDLKTADKVKGLP